MEKNLFLQLAKWADPESLPVSLKLTEGKTRAGNQSKKSTLKVPGPQKDLIFVRFRLGAAPSYDRPLLGYALLSWDDKIGKGPDIKVQDHQKDRLLSSYYSVTIHSG